MFERKRSVVTLSGNAGMTPTGSVFAVEIQAVLVTVALYLSGTTNCDAARRTLPMCQESDGRDLQMTPPNSWSPPLLTTTVGEQWAPRLLKPQERNKEYIYRVNFCASFSVKGGSFFRGLLQQIKPGMLPQHAVPADSQLMRLNIK
ncbi:hypothetical protein MAR_026773, partial [Mya arenaria]